MFLGLRLVKKLKLVNSLLQASITSKLSTSDKFKSTIPLKGQMSLFSLGQLWMINCCVITLCNSLLLLLFLTGDNF